MPKVRRNCDEIGSLQTDETIRLVERIALRAQELWGERGFHHRDHWSDWIRAEAEISEWGRHKLATRGGIQIKSRR